MTFNVTEDEYGNPILEQHAHGSFWSVKITDQLDYIIGRLQSIRTKQLEKIKEINN